MLAGIFQILQTPFHDDGAIDWDSYGRQVEYCLAVGAHGLVTPALASEFFTLSDAERFAVVEYAATAIDGRVPLVVGVQGLTLASALTFANHAAEIGASALMAMPPYLRKAGKNELVKYYRALAGFERPLIIQNAPAPIGTPLSPAELVNLLASEANIQYIKEETIPILQHIDEILALEAGDCAGVFGGANGIYLIDELRRGACGNMPAGGLLDLQVKVYDMYRAGAVDEAEALNDKLLPLLNYAHVYGVSFHKYVLWRRGVLASPFVRDPQRISLNGNDVGAVARNWARIADAANAEYPFV